MKEICLEKLKEWFGDLEFEYVVMQETKDDCIFITISEGYKKNERRVEVYRVFKMGDGLEISCDLEYIVYLERDSSILAMVENVIKTYERVK